MDAMVEKELKRLGVGSSGFMRKCQELDDMIERARLRFLQTNQIMTFHLKDGKKHSKKNLQEKQMIYSYWTTWERYATCWKKHPIPWTISNAVINLCSR